MIILVYSLAENCTMVWVTIVWCGGQGNIPAEIPRRQSQGSLYQCCKIILWVPFWSVYKLLRSGKKVLMSSVLWFFQSACLVMKQSMLQCVLIIAQMYSICLFMWSVCQKAAVLTPLPIFQRHVLKKFPSNTIYSARHTSSKTWCASYVVLLFTLLVIISLNCHYIYIHHILHSKALI